jgi:CPA1 family monovalent cation:H+ antiporter
MSMQLFDVVAVLVTVTALFSYLNHRYIRLHPSVGIMLVALVASLAVVAVGRVEPAVHALATHFLRQVHFDAALLQWMLGFLLFAGALTVDLSLLLQELRVTVLLSTVATIASTFIVALLLRETFGAVGLPNSWIGCLLLGALISPTDPVAVVAVMKRAGVPENIETIVAAESLFNDGVGVVLFLTILEASVGADPPTASGIAWMFCREALSGALLGLFTGWIAYFLLRRVSDYSLEILLTLALAMGTYSLASHLHVSAPIAVVMAGILIGNRGPTLRLREKTADDLEHFWELIDELLNAVLFVLIGLEVLVMPFNLRHVVAGVMAIPLVLLARWVTVFGVNSTLGRRKLDSGTRKILVWGGLRGGLAVAMALSLPLGSRRDAIVVVTYAVVCFSILVQGSTIRSVVKRNLDSMARRA